MSTKSKKTSFLVDFHLILRIIKLAKPHKSTAYIALLFTILATILAPIRPLLVQYTLDYPIANKDVEGITIFSSFILIHLILNSIVVFGNTYISNLLGQKVIEDFVGREEVGFGKVAQPLRAALTGSNVSPGISEVLDWLGKEESLARIKDQI